MLTPKESELLARIQATYSAALEGRKTDLNGSIEDVLSLCEAVKRLARLKPTEFDFPEHIGMADILENTAYAIKYVALVPAENEIQWPGSEPEASVTALEFTGKCEFYEAYFCVRPYVEVLEPRTAEALEELRQARLSFFLEDDALVRKGPIEEHLVGLDGYGVRRKPFSFAGLAPRHVLSAMTLEMKPDGAFLAGPPELGVGIRRDDRFRVELTALPRLPIRIRVGAVLALYTTKGGPTQFPGTVL